METLSAIFYVVLCLFTISWVYIQWRLNYWHRKGVQTLKPTIVIGNAKSILLGNDSVGTSILKLTRHFKSKGLSFCGLYFFVQPVFVPIDTDLIKSILVSDFNHFMDRPLVNHEFDPFSSNMIAARGSKWKLLRSKLAPAFTKSKNKLMFPTVQGPVNTMVKILEKYCEKNEEIDIKDLISRLTMDVLASCAFGLEINSLKENRPDFMYYAKEFLSMSLKNSFIFLCTLLFPELLILLKVKLVRNDIAKFFSDSITETVHYREINNIIRKDLMHLLIQVRNNVEIVDDKIGTIQKDSKRTCSLSLEEIIAQCFAFFVAGYESSSSTVSFCLYEMCLNEIIQEKARKEISEAVYKDNGVINYETLARLPYLENCIKETLRKYPTLPFLFRTCTKKYQIRNSDVALEKGTTCLISVLNLHYDPEVYPDPERFDPERFSKENIHKQHSLSWIPFGQGPRICIAYNFGLMQVTLTLATLLMNYKFTLNPKTKVPIVICTRSIQTSARDAIWLDVKKINS